MQRRYRRAAQLLLASLLTFLAQLASPGAAHSAKGIDVAGRLDLSFETRERMRGGVLEKEARIQLETPRHEGTKAVADLRLSSESGGLDLRELFLDFKAEGGGRWMAGQVKKRFGLDWDFNAEERLTLSRGELAKKLGLLSFGGRDSAVAYRRGDFGEASLQQELSFHSSDGLNAAAIFQLKRRLGGHSYFVSYSLIQGDSIDKRWVASPAQAFAFVSNDGTLRWEAELVAARDWIESELTIQRGEGRSVVFTAASLGASWRFSKLEPFVRGSLLLDDLRALSRRTGEGIAGARYHLRERLLIGTELVIVSSHREGEDRAGTPGTLDGASRLNLLMRYLF